MRSSVTRLVLYASPFLLAALGAVFYFSLPSRDSAATQSGSVQVAGSETMRAVMTACAEDFMTRHPQSDIVVKGGGSGDGIAALLHGMIDIGMTSRELSQRERDYAQSKGIDVAISELALDGITIVVNRANPLLRLILRNYGTSLPATFATGRNSKAGTPISCRSHARPAPERLRYSMSA